MPHCYANVAASSPFKGYLLSNNKDALARGASLCCTHCHLGIKIPIKGLMHFLKIDFFHLLWGKKNKSAQDFRWGAGQTSPWYFQAGKGWIRLVWYFCTAEQLPPLLLLSLIALIAGGQGRSHLPAPPVCGSFHPQLVPQAWISAPTPPGAAGHTVGAHLLSLFLRIKLMLLIKRHHGVAGRQSPVPLCVPSESPGNVHWQGQQSLFLRGNS